MFQLPTTLFGHLVAGPLNMPESPKKKRMKDPWSLDFTRGTPGVALIRALLGQAKYLSNPRASGPEKKSHCRVNEPH